MKKVVVSLCCLFNAFAAYSIDTGKNATISWCQNYPLKSVEISELGIEKKFEFLQLLKVEEKRKPAPPPLNECPEALFTGKFTDHESEVEIVWAPHEGYGPPLWQLADKPYKGSITYNNQKMALQPCEAESIGKQLELLESERNKKYVPGYNLLGH